MNVVQTWTLSAITALFRWMQDNVKGSPVIAHALSAGIQYEWFNRFSIYTGLPDVVGWEWHQEQQRVMFTDTVRARGVEEDAFHYNGYPGLPEFHSQV